MPEHSLRQLQPRDAHLRVEPKNRRSRSRRQAATHLLLLAPAMLLSLLVVFVPGVLTLLVSLTDWNGVAPSLKWVGVGNYQSIFHDEVFWQALYDNVRWVVLFLTIPVVIGMVTALLLLRRSRSRTAYQLIFLFPYVLAPVVNAMLWLNIIFNPVSGVLGFLDRIGLRLNAPLGNIHAALYAVAAVDIWHYWGFLTVIYLAALRQTPTDQIEAAQLEGVNAWQLFRYVYLPNILPTVQLMFTLIIIFSFLTFDYIYLLTGGGPAHATEMLSTYAYTFAFLTFQVGKASAVGVVIGLFGFLASLAYVWLTRRELAR